MRGTTRIGARAARLAVVALLALRALHAVALAAPRAIELEPRDEDGDGEGADDRDLDEPTGGGPVLAPPGGVAAADRLHAPPVAEVLEAAYAAAGLAHDPTRGWSRRARLGGLVPWLTVRTGWDASWKDDDPTIDRGRTFEVRATWRLDRLIFDGRELQVATIDTARRRERRRLASVVIRAYFAWRRLATAALDGHPRWASRTEEATAELDALTDGWFSERLAAPRRSASGFRTEGVP